LISGSETTAALDATSSYTLSCTGAAGTDQQAVTVTVTPGGGGGSMSTRDSGGGGLDLLSILFLLSQLLLLRIGWRAQPRAGAENRIR
jgi:hypothetical protein